MAGFDGINLDDAIAIGRDFLRSAFGGDDAPKLSDLLVGVSAWLGATSDAPVAAQAAEPEATQTPDEPYPGPAVAEMVQWAAEALSEATVGVAWLVRDARPAAYVAIAGEWRTLAEMVATTEAHR